MSGYYHSSIYIILFQSILMLQLGNPYLQQLTYLVEVFRGTLDTVRMAMAGNHSIPNTHHPNRPYFPIDTSNCKNIFSLLVLTAMNKIEADQNQ